MVSDISTSTAVRGRRWLIPAALVVVLLAALAVWLAGRGDGGSDPAGLPVGPEVDATVPETSSSGTTALLELLEVGRALTFHAVYEATISEDGATARVTLDLWRDDGWTRQDTAAESEGEATRTAGVRDPDGLVTLCVQQQGEPWFCTEQQSDADSDVFAAGALAFGDSTLVAEPATVAGHGATCFTVADEPDVPELCVRDDGIPVRIAALEIVELSFDVDRDVFVPPGETAG